MNQTSHAWMCRLASRMRIFIQTHVSGHTKFACVAVIYCVGGRKASPRVLEALKVMSLFRRCQIILFLGFMFAVMSWAQTAAFQGTVKGKDGKPAPGAQIKIQRQ